MVAKKRRQKKLFPRSRLSDGFVDHLTNHIFGGAETSAVFDGNEHRERPSPRGEATRPRRGRLELRDAEDLSVKEAALAAEEGLEARLAQGKRGDADETGLRFGGVPKRPAGLKASSLGEKSDGNAAHPLLRKAICGGVFGSARVST